MASHRCDDCDENICDDCVKAHKKLRITKDHKLTPIENNSSAQSISAAAGTPHDLRCSIHLGEKLLIFCEICEVLTCKECQLGEKHNGHKHRPTHEVAPDVKASLSQAVSDVRLKRNVLGKNGKMFLSVFKNTMQLF